MNDKTSIRTELIKFRDCDKYTVYQDLQPAVANSTADTRQLVEEEMQDCCNRVLEYLDTPNPMDEKLKNIVRSSVDQIEDALLDTEDTEFCYELYAVIGNILGIDIQDHSISMGEKLKEDMLRLMAKGGIDMNDLPSDFLENLNKLK